MTLAEPAHLEPASPATEPRKNRPFDPAERGNRGLPIAIVLALIPITLAGIYSYRSAAQEMTAAVLAKRESIAYLIATVLTEKLDHLSDLGLSLATRVRFRALVENKQWNRAIKIMESVPATFPYVERLFLADPDGVLVADTPALPGVRGRSFAYRDWYQGVVRTGGPYVSEIYERRAAPQINVMAVAVPIKGAANELLGILVMQIGLGAFFEWFKDAPAEPTWLIYIVDRNGQAAFHPDYTPRGATVNLAQMPGVQQALQGRRGIQIAPHPPDGAEQISAYAPVERYGWGVVLSEPARTAFAARDAQLRRFAVVYTLLLLLGGVIAFLLLRAREQGRRKADLELLVAERTADLELANKELEAFSYSVSHDLRAPLRSIDGFSRVLLEECEERLDGRHRGYLGRIRAATQRMGNLIDDLLKLSRVTRAEMNHTNVDLTALAHAIVADLRGSSPPREVVVEIHPGVTATGDPVLLRALLENLLGNAWKFTGKTAAARIEFGCTRDGSAQPVYFVRDNGAGFDPAYAHKLFDAFQRLHGVEDFPGTGIGLATVQRIVRRHGGRVWAEGAVGRGATFYFTLGSRHNKEP